MTAACIGSGLIGSGWAVGFALKGLDTFVYDVEDGALDLAKKRVQSAFVFFREEGILDEKGVEACMRRMHFTTDLSEAVAHADFIQENGPEDYGVKKQIIRSIEAHVHPEALIASSTSGLIITRVAEEAQHPERILGAHPYNPPHLIPLVELTRGERTSAETLEKALALYRSIDKEPIVLRKEAPGFISNRLALALYREAVDLVERGICTVEEVDKACLYGPGLRYGLMGPNLIYQLGGGVHGIAGILAHIGPSIETWWDDMADWKRWPEGYGARVQKGVDAEMANRTPEHGRTNEDITTFRDKGLVMLLKYHGKL